MKKDDLAIELFQFVRQQKYKGRPRWRKEEVPVTDFDGFQLRFQFHLRFYVDPVHDTHVSPATKCLAVVPRGRGQDLGAVLVGKTPTRWQMCVSVFGIFPPQQKRSLTEVLASCAHRSISMSPETTRSCHVFQVVIAFIRTRALMSDVKNLVAYSFHMCIILCFRCLVSINQLRT